MTRLVSWKECTTSHSELDSPRKIDRKDRSRRKRNNLHKGVLRWIRDTCAGDLLPRGQRRRFHRVMLFSLTCASLEWEPARGEMQRLMKDYRYVHPGGRYVWWVETQLRGALHFHGMLLDPPIASMRRELGTIRAGSARRRGHGTELHRSRATLGPGPCAAADVGILDDIGVVRKWFDAHWHLADIQSWVGSRSADWFRKYAGAYALKDVRKLSGKRYEQQYDRMPPRWRVYARSDLQFTNHEHELHEDKGEVRLTFVPLQRSPNGEHIELYETVPELLAVRKHVPAIGGCRLFRLRPRRARAAAARASSANSRRRGEGHTPRRPAGGPHHLRGSPTRSLVNHRQESPRALAPSSAVYC